MESFERLFCASLSTLLFFNSLVMIQAQYECGQHGRFEYCIDGIPGCVVGCHCHPGYYFDTDTKICEPNAQLTQDYRRHYSLEPTRIPLSSMLTQAEVANPTSNTTDVVGKNVDAITDDVDDLGNWLYSQFFKTIENQVINNTETEKKTRRSSPNGFLKARKPKRSSRRKHTSKKKFSKKGLRRKLLRITEDDSLFDSRSNSGSVTSDESSSSSTDSDSDSSGEDKEGKGSGHGKRKIIMYSKKPTPPLPSFIFLPNIETPFYPPIGLPPPPIVPMYPNVPVPPMYPGTIIKCEDAATSNNSTTEPPKHEDPTTKQSTVTEKETAPPKDPEKEEQILRYGNLRRGDKHRERSGLLHKLREKMQKRYKTPPHPRFNEPSDILESLHKDDSMLQEFMKYQRESSPTQEKPETEDVNFKYLSQLIHKPNRNKTKNPGHPKLTVDVVDPKYNFRKFANNLGMTVNENNQVNKNTSLKLDEGDNSYYTKLGREIASLIRTFGSKTDTHGDIEQRQQKTDTKFELFNENNFAPRSFWERSVRSALNDFRFYTEEFDLDNSEKLISLEEHANFAASTKPTLTLQELENIVHFIDRTRDKIQKKQFKDKLKVASVKRLDINLLPAETNRQSNLMIPRRMQKSNNEITNTYKFTPIQTNRHLIVPANIPPKINKMKHQSINTLNTNKTVDMYVDGKSISAKNFNDNLSKTSLLNFWNKANVSPLLRQVSKLINNKNTPNRDMVKYPQKPSADKYNNWNHNKHFEKPLFQKSNHLEYENTYQVPLFPVQTIQRKIPSSYFHHEGLHHFDYFD